MCKTKKKFCLYLRKEIYYAKVIDRATGLRRWGKSTGKTTEAEANDVALEWYYNGIPDEPKPADSKFTNISDDSKRSPVETVKQLLAKLPPDQLAEIANDIQQDCDNSVSSDSRAVNENQDFIKLALEYWNFDKSPYVQGRLLRGHHIRRPYCEQSRNRIKNYWMDKFAKRTVGSIKRKDLKDFELKLSQKKQKNGKVLAAKTVKDIVSIGIEVLNWAYTDGGLSGKNIAEKFGGVAVEFKERGVPEMEESEELFARTWKDKCAYVGNLLMNQSGMRTGEVLGLQRKDIGDEAITTPNGDIIYILNLRRAWEPKEQVLKVPMTIPMSLMKQV